MKGYLTNFGYLGWIGYPIYRYMLFSTESEYVEYMKGE